ncbi:hypothetical protein ACWGST_00220 [Agromyces sp. NPDC055520]
MNTAIRTQRIIATALLAVTAGLALASCATRQNSESDAGSSGAASVAQPWVGTLDLAERRAKANAAAAAAEHRAADYADQAERRAGMSSPSGMPTYRDLAERRLVADR